MTAGRTPPEVSLAHEVRTRLSTIMGFAQIMADRRAGPVTAEQGEYLGDIVEAARQLLACVDDHCAPGAEGGRGA